MATSPVPLTSGTGANQYSDQMFALPTAGQSSSPGAGTGYEMFTPTATSPVPEGNPYAGTVVGQSGNFVPNQPTPVLPSPVSSKTPNEPGYGPGTVSGVQSQGAGVTSILPQDPGFTQAFYNFLQSQLGSGAPAFDLSTILPSSGAATTPGALSAPETQLNQMLQQFYQTGTGGPTGASELANLSATGGAVNQTPAWQAMLAAEQQNTNNNAANLREQFASGGDLSSSPFASAMTQFYNQNTLNQNAQLTAATTQAEEQAAQNQLQASTELTGGATGLAGSLQTMDQQAIQNMLAEFIRTSPDYNPLLSQAGGAATTYAPTYQGGVGLGGVGAAVGSAGTALSGIADLWSALDPSKQSANPMAGTVPIADQGSGA